MSLFEDKLDLHAREREARIRAGDRLPIAPDALGDDRGFLPPDKAAARMGIPTAELLRLAEGGVLARRGRGYDLRIRPAILSGSVSTLRTAERQSASTSRDRELSASRDRALADADRPHVGWADDG